MSARVVTVNEVLDGNAAPDLERLDRIYLNAYVPILQSSGQVVAFMTQHLGLPIPSPALFEKIGTRFRAAVASFAEANHIALVRFRKEDRKAEVMRPFLERQWAAGPGAGAGGGGDAGTLRRTAWLRGSGRTPGPAAPTRVGGSRRARAHPLYLRRGRLGRRA